MYFQFKDYVYGTSFKDNFIILDVKKDNYYLFDSKETSLIRLILKEKFHRKSGNYLPQKKTRNIIQLNEIIKNLLEQKLIKETNLASKNHTLQSNSAPKGVKNIDWRLPDLKLTKKRSL